LTIGFRIVAVNTKLEIRLNKKKDENRSYDDC
jgi:hypothetical protein